MPSQLQAQSYQSRDQTEKIRHSYRLTSEVERLAVYLVILLGKLQDFEMHLDKYLVVSFGIHKR